MTLIGVQWLIKNKKPWGFYHYLDDDGKNASGKTEAEFWVRNTSSYFGKGMPWADYEAQAAGLGTGYLKEFLDTVYHLTGVKPGVYCSLSVVQSQNFVEIAASGYPLWVAQYADMAVVNGFVENPWQKGSVSPFARYVMHQYTGNGRLNGYGNALDLDKFWGTREQWAKMLAAGNPAEEEPIVPVKPDKKKVSEQVVADVLAGKYGIREDRRRRLEAAGYNYDEVQNKINELYGMAGKIAPIVSGNKEYLSLIVKIIRDSM